MTEDTPHHLRAAMTGYELRGHFWVIVDDCADFARPMPVHVENFRIAIRRSLSILRVVPPVGVFLEIHRRSRTHRVADLASWIAPLVAEAMISEHVIESDFVAFWDTIFAQVVAPSGLEAVRVLLGMRR
jgi:hypothetical protein